MEYVPRPSDVLMAVGWMLIGMGSAIYFAERHSHPIQCNHVGVGTVGYNGHKVRQCWIGAAEIVVGVSMMIVGLGVWAHGGLC